MALLNASSMGRDELECMIYTCLHQADKHKRLAHCARACQAGVGWLADGQCQGGH